LVASQRRTRTNPLIAAPYVIGFILIGLSWNSVDPPLVSLVGGGIFLVATIVSRAAARRKPKSDQEEPKGDVDGRTN